MLLVALAEMIALLTAFVVTVPMLLIACAESYTETYESEVMIPADVTEFEVTVTEPEVTDVNGPTRETLLAET
jgi:hypothetical protein